MFISVLVSCVNVITLKNVHLKCFQVSLCHFCRAESQTPALLDDPPRVAASALAYVIVFVWLDCTGETHPSVTGHLSG